MRASYDFSKSNSKPNPYAKRLTKLVTIRIDGSTFDYFKRLSDELEIPYQTLISFHLRYCATSGRKLPMAWQSKGAR